MQNPAKFLKRTTNIETEEQDPGGPALFLCCAGRAFDTYPDGGGLRRRAIWIFSDYPDGDCRARSAIWIPGVYPDGGGLARGAIRIPGAYTDMGSLDRRPVRIFRIYLDANRNRNGRDIRSTSSAIYNLKWRVESLVMQAYSVYKTKAGIKWIPAIICREFY